MKRMKKSTYIKPVVTKMDNVLDITRECPQFQCSIAVPPPPAG